MDEHQLRSEHHAAGVSHWARAGAQAGRAAYSQVLLARDFHPVELHPEPAIVLAKLYLHLAGAAHRGGIRSS